MVRCIGDRIEAYYHAEGNLINPVLTGFPFALARKSHIDPFQYVLVSTWGPSAFEVCYVTTLNSTSPAELSPHGKPLLWVVPDIEMTPSRVPGGTLDALLAINYKRPPLRLTGGMRLDARAPGGRALQAEVLLEEDALLRVCCYCGCVERANHSTQFERCGGRGYNSLYWCLESATSLPFNSTSPAELSPHGKPLLWVVPDIEMTPSRVPGGTLDALLAINYKRPPLRLTGGMRLDARAPGGRALQAEVLLEEDALLRFERCGGRGYNSLYWCLE
ncbi:hypothetical protein PUNSTDRAFT_143573, partial [Punctularia strigosozonata HHB-11173 SS5]|uniref:uncharacterized protein n=1 Tax=Punctularia strigosozonata (strain HHB-11173) TaxID=741275 RepID=UPI0004416B4B